MSAATRLAPLVLAACSLTTSLDELTPCVDLDGQWDVSGSCGADTCVITQRGCAAELRCSGGTVAYSGSVDRAALHYTGLNAQGVLGTCDGVADGGAIEGTCAAVGYPSCRFVASKR